MKWYTLDKKHNPQFIRRSEFRSGDAVTENSTLHPRLKRGNPQEKTLYVTDIWLHIIIPWPWVTIFSLALFNKRPISIYQSFGNVSTRYVSELISYPQTESISSVLAVSPKDFKFSPHVIKTLHVSILNPSSVYSPILRVDTSWSS